MSSHYQDEGSAPRGFQHIEEMSYDIVEQEPTPERTALIVELAIRMRDLHDFDKRLSFKLLFQLLRIYQEHPGSFRVCLDVLAGNAIGDVSLSVLADQTPLKYSKQNMHQTEQRRFEELAQHLPRIAQVLAEIRGRTIAESEE